MVSFSFSSWHELTIIIPQPRTCACCELLYSTILSLHRPMHARASDHHPARSSKSPMSIFLAPVLSRRTTAHNLPLTPHNPQGWAAGGCYSTSAADTVRRLATTAQHLIRASATRMALYTTAADKPGHRLLLRSQSRGIAPHLTCLLTATVCRSYRKKGCVLEERVRAVRCADSWT